MLSFRISLMVTVMLLLVCVYLLAVELLLSTYFSDVFDDFVVRYIDYAEEVDKTYKTKLLHAMKKHHAKEHSTVCNEEEGNTGVCVSPDSVSRVIQVFDNGDLWIAGKAKYEVSLTYAECSNDEDFDIIVCGKIDRPNCNNGIRLYSGYGTIVYSCDDLKALEQTYKDAPSSYTYHSTQNAIFLVPDKRPFLHSPRSIGESVQLYHLDSPFPVEGPSQVFVPGQPLFSSYVLSCLLETVPRLLYLQLCEVSPVECRFNPPDTQKQSRPITLATISQSPPIFRLTNFFTPREAEQIITNALTISTESHRLKRSSTGSTGYTVDNKRTSETAFDTHSMVAQTIKKRGFELLGVSPYNEQWADGLQVLRYNLTTAYHNHMDWINPKTSNQKDNHNYNSADGGTNRFATILLYLSDVEEGGETVFPKVPRPSLLQEDAAPMQGSNLPDELSSVLPPETHNWQRTMVKDCRTKLSIRPAKAEAVLFYSQFADGSVDQLSLHGGCPVIEGQKWAANLWVWNGPRVGYAASPKPNPGKPKLAGHKEIPRRESKSASPNQNPPVSATFYSVDREVVLYWETNLWGTLIPGVEMKVKTFAGHRWNVKTTEGTHLARWIIKHPNEYDDDGGGGENQYFSLSLSDNVAGEGESIVGDGGDDDDDD